MRESTSPLRHNRPGAVNSPNVLKIRKSLKMNKRSIKMAGKDSNVFECWLAQGWNFQPIACLAMSKQLRFNYLTNLIKAQPNAVLFRK